MYNEMSNFPLWLLNAGLNLAFTVILYGVGPLFFYQTKIFPTTKKKVMTFSIIYTILAWLSFNLIRALWFGGGEIKLYPAVIWGAIFYNLLLKGLKKTGRLESPGSESGYWVPEPLKPTQKEPTEKTEKEKASSFYESEKASEQQSQKFGPLDPPQKRKPVNKVFLFRAIIVLMICCLGGLAMYGAYKTASLTNQLRNAENWKTEYDQLKYDYDFLSSEYRDLLVEHATLESDYTALDENFAYTIERSAFLMHNIGFIVNGSGYYHSYDCDAFLNADEFWAHNIEYCEYLGYNQCPYCW